MVPRLPTSGGSPVALLVAIVNYRTPDVTIQCLRSLAPELGSIVGGARAVVVDNASGDDSAARIVAEIRARGWGGWARLVEADRNPGFAAGTNRAIEAGFSFGRPRFVLMLNSDTVVRPGAIVACLERMRAEPTIGVFSCKLEGADGSVQTVARLFPTPWRVFIETTGLPWAFPGWFGWANTEDPGWDRATIARDVEWLGGAFLLVRAELLERIGGLDEDFFLYGEDIEFCHRVARAGFRRRYDPGASIVHLGGASSDATRMPAKSRQASLWKGRYLVQHRCYGAGAALFVRLVDILGCAIRLAWHTVSPLRKETRFRELKGILALLVRPLEGAR
jgi:N-acetylglucosaminyl-diphospho-decaprenol L-rhamnosyltransferase